MNMSLRGVYRAIDCQGGWSSEVIGFGLDLDGYLGVVLHHPGEGLETHFARSSTMCSGQVSVVP